MGAAETGVDGGCETDLVWVLVFVGFDVLGRMRSRVRGLGEFGKVEDWGVDEGFGGGVWRILGSGA